MIKKYTVLAGIIAAVLLLYIATLVYPGGSLADKNSVGFLWSKNFISNLFGEKAVNGAANPSRIWADAGMILLSASFALFFSHFSKKIPLKTPANIIKYMGLAGMLCTILIVTALHDIMITISSTLFLVSMFYITVFMLKTRLHLLKVLCIVGLLIFYYTLYLYGAGQFEFLPVIQKINFGSAIIQVLCLEYFTKKEDFEKLMPQK